MRKILALLAAVAAMTGLLVAVGPAEAVAPTSVTVQATGDGTQVPLPSSMSGYRPQIPKTCVANGDNSLPIGEMAQSWNNVSVDAYGQSLLLTFASNCVTLGYSAGQRFTIDTYYSATDGLCVHGSREDYVLRGGFAEWTNNPLYQLNTNPAYGCTDTLFHRRHFTAIAVGRFIGFKGNLNSAGWAGRVMCACSKNTIQYPTAGEGAELATLMRNGYIGPF